MLPTAQRQRLLKACTDPEADELLHDWDFNARDEQKPPPGDWAVWVLLAGRGFGKTLSGAQWVRHKIKEGCRHVALVAPTTADVRKVMVEGQEPSNSGLLKICWPLDRDCYGNHMGVPNYEPSLRTVTWANGAVATTYSAEEANRLRGPQHDAAWADELSSWNGAEETWDMLMFGLRVGSNPQVMVTTTPKPLALLRELLRAPDTVVTKGSTYDNRANLSPKFFAQVIRKYEGTRLGRQELSGELLDEAEGALWNRGMIQYGAAPDMARIVIGVDPAVTDNADSNLTGIVVAGLGRDGMGYVLEDLSGRYSPHEWAKVVVRAYHEHKADRVIAEGNQGGELVRHTLHTEDRGLPVKMVHASRGKMARAEPVQALYEQGRIFHTRGFQELEDQMCTWEPMGKLGSPDRLDAMVWAMTALMVTGARPVHMEGEASDYLGEPLTGANIGYW